MNTTNPVDSSAVAEELDIFESFEKMIKDNKVEIIDKKTITKRKRWIERKKAVLNFPHRCLLWFFRIVFNSSILIFFFSLFITVVLGVVLVFVSWIDPDLTAWYAENVSLWFLLIIGISVVVTLIAGNMKDWLESKIQPIRWYFTPVIHSSIGLPEKIQKVVSLIADINKEYGNKRLGNIKLRIERPVNDECVILSANVCGCKFANNNRSGSSWESDTFYFFFKKTR